MMRPVFPAAHRVADSEKYELGKAIFLGKAVLKEQANTDKLGQRTRLVSLQERLPARVQKTVDLASLCGKLSEDQFAALQHFLKVRLKVD